MAKIFAIFDVVDYKIILENICNNKPLSPPSFLKALQVRHQLGSAVGKTRQGIMRFFSNFKFKIIIGSIIIFLPSSIYSQNFQFLKTFGTKYGNEVVQRVCAEKNGGCVALLQFAVAGSIPDTLRLGYYSYVKSKDAQVNFLIRLDSNGKVTKVRLISAGSMLTNMSRNEKGSFYVLGQITASSTIFDTLTLYKTDGTLIIAKYDNNLNLIWLKQTGGAPKDLFLSQGHLLFNCYASGTVKVGQKTFNFKGSSIIYGQIDTVNGNILWCNFLYDFTSSSYLVNLMGIQYLKGNFYIIGTCNNDVKISTKQFYQGGFVVQVDSSGNYFKHIFLSKDISSGFSISTDGEYLFISAVFSDSIEWKGSKYYSQYPPPAGSNPKLDEFYIASLTASLEHRWFYRPKLIDKKKGGMGTISCSTTNEGYLYFGGYFYTTISIDSNIIKPSGSGIDILLLKMDYLGNVLWATNGGTDNGQLFGLDGIAGKFIFFSGQFENVIKFGSYRETAMGLKDGWTGKISDNSIFRGNIKKGPYCAGDSIRVPYVKNGDFDTSNVFIAELSDEEGSFDTIAREFGRIKSNSSGTIIGKLPSFQVSTSGHYRVRIRSTSPKIQSFYRIDTLRLLIYSKDKANPGPPETICRGDSIKISSLGGSQWTWRPKYKMNDSTLRQPLVWPPKDTIYKIIISESHGCGKPDTAFKKIIVRPYPKTILGYTDTSLCDNSPIKIPMRFEGGDSNYSWKWFFVSSPKAWYPMSAGNLKLKDTLTYYPAVDANTSEKLAIILKDGCTNKADTAYLIISQRKPVIIKSTYRDTTLCTGNLLKYKATATGGMPKKYRYQWKDLVSNSILSTTDSLKFLTKKALKIQLIVNDGCEALGDTAEFEVKVKPELKAITNLRDTIICSGKTLNFSVSATGGTGKAYKFLWVLNGKQIDTTKSLTLTSALTSTLKLITKDNCSTNDTVKKTITVNPSPKADFSWDLACSRTVTKFQFMGSKPNSPITTIFHWNFNNESPSYLENPSYLFTLAGTKKISLATTSSNGCTDTIKKDVVIKSQSKADFTATDVCETDSAVFINKSLDGTGYNWKFGDGLNSKLQNPKHQYQISISTTFNVTLVAKVTNGCADSVTKAVTINKNPSSDFSYTYNGIKVDLKITKAGNSYQWKFGTTDSVKTSATTYTHTIKSSDQTKVCLTATDNISGCSSQTCKNVSVGILKLFPESFKIYPNPNNGSFTIEIENPAKDASIEIFNLLGERVARVEKVGKVNSLDLGVAEGIYLVRVKNAGSVWSQKVFVQNF